ncbi:MAG: AsmA-like C-terminal region-containing protein [Pseudomonadota bacterium]
MSADPTRQRIDFSEINVQSSLASGIATGHTYLTEFNGDWPGAYLGQFQLTDVAYEGGETFASSVALQDIRADLRLRLDPFEVELGHVAIDNQGVPIAATGRVSADDAGWHVAVDATTSVIDAPRVLEFWPQRVAPITRSWVARNLLQGTLINPALGLRFDGGEEPDLALSFNFDEGKARFLPDMPYLENASGRAVLQNHRFALELASGEIAAEDGEIVDAQGSSFIVLDTRPKPSFGEINVAASGRLEAVLDILNNRPLRLMERAGRPVDLAEARVDGQATITLPLKDGIETEEITYAVTANLTDVSSRELVQDRELTSPGLQLTASPDAIAINGPARLDRVPITANWRQPLGANAANGAEISGRITLSEDTVDAFDLPLPNEFLRGESEAEYQIDLPAENDASPLLTLRSDLYGLGFSLPSIGWRKTIEERGELRLSARLGDTPEIEELTLETEDLSFEGNLSLAPDGSLQRAEFGALELGDWLDADIVVTPPPDGGPPSVAVRGGTLDLRQMQLGAGGTTSAGGAMPVTLELDRLTVSDTIAFAPLRGRVQMGAGGLSGTFEARINGGTAIQGVLSPANAGTAIRITSADAAGVLRDAGLTPNAQSGSLDLVLTPVANTGNGTFDGEFLIEDMRLKDAPAMAELLDAVSVVGLLDQLGGAGIRFETIDGSFRMNRRQIRLRQAAAVGPSMGISADGIFDLQRRRMDLQGVVSPVYFLNGIGSFLTRRGEGLFGFNYRMAGAASDPSVRVNPLSILTPGAFRQIFRRAPPGG